MFRNNARDISSTVGNASIPNAYAEQSLAVGTPTLGQQSAQRDTCAIIHYDDDHTIIRVDDGKGAGELEVGASMIR